MYKEKNVFDLFIVSFIVFNNIVFIILYFVNFVKENGLLNSLVGLIYNIWYIKSNKLLDMVFLRFWLK